MLKYRWICHLCEEVNAPTSSICEKCGFPAIASLNDMESARNNFVSNSIQPSNTLNQKSLPKKLVGGIALATLIIGGMLARFADPAWLNVTGLLLTGVAALVFWTIR